MLRLALATASKYPNLTSDDRLLLDPLTRHGIQAHPAIWNDPNQEWSANAAVVIRSCWDYHLHPEAPTRFAAAIAHAVARTT